ncbi:MAG: NAD(P)/FAD-dependent oxidoreductase [Sphaerochaetaceae bacterium]|jgi:glycerol-3-phosphate dehydrogenase|nr:NAD(P)/FAD-dependent oxidoreductase [Sphaerochaetaceae bacterium]MDD4259305.1 NAD(P)/FAD-dependent oxidoreductase [Sphaerochaetaceae bacterium]MDX9933718.1 NAD(P)/FAD-dependent oxidoreductase [Sphaerochaetaceae bacterium]NLO60725.1 NAD(P)/FAD-dependent oxidoreductase [Spirochaetales bacterium]
MELFDVAIIGAGVVGAAIARELSKTTARVIVFEREADVAFATSGRNSGVVHSGIHYAPGSLRARLNVAGNASMKDVCKNLNVPFEQIGKLTVAFDQDQVSQLHRLRAQGEANNVPGLELLDATRMQTLQPGIAGIKGLYSPTTGIVNPMLLTIALAEHAHENQVVFKFLHEVKAIGSHYDEPLVMTCATPTGEVSYKAKVVVNCAGLHAGKIAMLTGFDSYTVYPCRGEYFVLDKQLKDELNILVYPVPGAHSGGLGIHLTKTTEGNILIGPSNEYIDDGDDVSSTKAIMKQLKEEGSELLPSLQTGDFIRSFAGVRPKLTPPELGGYHDFVIEAQEDIPRMIHLLGIESPGLTSAPAIARMVVDMIDSHIPLSLKRHWSETFKENTNLYRRCYPLSHYDLSDRQELMRSNSDYGTIVCRCEQISKAEILSAIDRIFGPITLNGIKNRSRISTGRCQGGFCIPRIVTILKEYHDIGSKDIWWKGPNSPMFIGNLRTAGGSDNE